MKHEKYSLILFFFTSLVLVFAGVLIFQEKQESKHINSASITSFEESIYLEEIKLVKINKGKSTTWSHQIPSTKIYKVENSELGS